MTTGNPILDGILGAGGAFIVTYGWRFIPRLVVAAPARLYDRQKRRAEVHVRDKETKEYTFSGSVELRGVTATSPEEAKRKAAEGDYDEYDTSGAETVNWEINTKTCEEN